MKNFFETENEVVEVADIVSAIIDAIRKRKQTMRITILSEKIFGIECNPEDVSEVVRWFERRSRINPIMLAKVEFLHSKEKPLYFIKPKQGIACEELTKQCTACGEKCKVKEIQKISEKQLWAVLNQKKHSGVMHIVNENGYQMCTNGGLMPNKLLEVLQKNKAKFFCFEGKEAYYITKK